MFFSCGFCHGINVKTMSMCNLYSFVHIFSDTDMKSKMWKKNKISLLCVEPHCILNAYKLKSSLEMPWISAIGKILCVNILLQYKTDLQFLHRAGSGGILCTNPEAPSSCTSTPALPFKGLLGSHWSDTPILVINYNLVLWEDLVRAMYTSINVYTLEYQQKGTETYPVAYLRCSCRLQ